PPRLKDHLVPPLLQQRLPFLAVRAPSFPGRLAATLCFFGGRVELVLQIVPRNQVRIGGVRSSRFGLRRSNVSAGVAATWRWRRLECDGRLYTTKVTRQ